MNLVERGFRVFPCRPGSKRPTLEGWKESAFSDPLDAAEKWPGDQYNVGIHCKGLAVLDIDVKNGRDGLADLETLPPLPPTYTVRTPSGGKHLYFKLPDGVEVSNSAKGLPSGFDIRGVGGYVLAPGSVFEGKRYEIETYAPVAPAPEWLLQRLREAPTAKSEPGAQIGELDTPAAVERAKAIIKKAEPAHEGNRGDETTYKLAARVTRLGISQDLCFDLMRDWNDRCEPPWDDADLERIIGNAWRYGQEPVGVDNPLAGMVPVPKMPNPFGARCTNLGLDDAEEAAIPPRPWLVPGLLLRRQSTLLIAPGGSGKSTFSLNVAAAVALGDGRLIGMEISEGTRVLIVNAEDDIDEQNRRTQAMLRHFKLSPSTLRSRVVTYDVRSGGYRPFIAAVRDAQKQPAEGPDVGNLIEFARDGGFGLIVVDPLVKTHRLNENDNGEMDFLAGVYSRIAEETGAAVLLLHHTKKPSQASADGFEGDANSGRGASALNNAARITRTMQPMTEKEAKRLGVPEAERRHYSRLDDAKGNYAALRSDARWFRLQSVTLRNGDNAPAMAPAEFKQAETDAKRHTEIMRRIIQADADGKGLAANTRGVHGADAFLAKALGVDRSVIKQDLELLLSRGDLEVFEDKKRTPRLRGTDQGRSWTGSGQEV